MRTTDLLHDVLLAVVNDYVNELQVYECLLFISELDY